MSVCILLPFQNLSERKKKTISMSNFRTYCNFNVKIIESEKIMRSKVQKIVPCQITQNVKSKTSTKSRRNCLSRKLCTAPEVANEITFRLKKCVFEKHLETIQKRASSRMNIGIPDFQPYLSQCAEKPI